MDAQVRAAHSQRVNSLVMALIARAMAARQPGLPGVWTQGRGGVARRVALRTFLTRISHMERTLGGMRLAYVHA